MSTERWIVARASGLKCYFDRTPIGAGEPYRMVTRLNHPICAACAKKRYDESVPADLPVVPLVKPVEHLDFSRFDRARTAGKVRGAIVDARQRQTGESA